MARSVSSVVKIGGAVLANAGHFGAVVEAVSAAAGEHALVVVPGGGPFADVVRAVGRDVGLPNDAAHWMAVLGMDQYAHLLAARLPRAALVAEPGEIAGALADGALPVLAPFRWLRRCDPLPHSWDVTSDSIAAWIAGELCARTLVLIKPAGANGESAVDAHFTRALPDHVAHTVLPADRVATLGSLLRGRG